jgi:hypothetical protein
MHSLMQVSLAYFTGDTHLAVHSASAANLRSALSVRPVNSLFLSDLGIAEFTPPTSLRNLSVTKTGRAGPGGLITATLLPQIDTVLHTGQYLRPLSAELHSIRNLSDKTLFPLHL